MPDELLERLDQFAEEHGYTGRSEVVREASRKPVGRVRGHPAGRAGPDGNRHGVVRLRDDERRRADDAPAPRTRESRRVELPQPRREPLLHGTVRPRGELEDISAFVGKIRATKDALTVDYSVMPVDSFDPLAQGRTAGPIESRFSVDESRRCRPHVPVPNGHDSRETGRSRRIPRPKPVNSIVLLSSSRKGPYDIPEGQLRGGRAGLECDARSERSA